MPLLSSAEPLTESGDVRARHRRRAAPVWRLAWAWELLSALAVAASAGLYARYQAWQALSALGLALLAAVLCRVSRRLSLSGRIGPAAVLLLLVGVIAPIAATAFVSDIALLSAALALSLPTGITLLAWPTRRLSTVLLLGVAGALLCAILGHVWPWERLDRAEVSLYVLSVVSLGAAGVATLLWLLARGPPGRSLRARLLFAFALVGAFPVTVALFVVAAWRWFLSPEAFPVASATHAGVFASEAALWAWLAALGLGGMVFSIALALRFAACIANPFRSLAIRACKADSACAATPASFCDEVEELSRAFGGIELRQQTEQREAQEAIASRTRELEQRCRYADAVAEVSRVSLSLLDARRFSRAVVEVIRARLELQYVGLYTLSRGEVWAELCADSASAGWQRPGQPSQVRLGQGLVGRAIGQAEVVLAGSPGAMAGADALDTAHGICARAALPLRSRGQVLGALFVHTDHPHGLSRELLGVLQTIGELAALALDHARAIEESREALAAAQRAAGKLSPDAWAEVTRARTDLGFCSSERGVQRADGVWSPRMARAVQGNVAVLGPREGDDRGGECLTVPVRIQGQVIGVLDACKPDAGGVWTTDQVALVERIAEHLSQALENARLYGETQRRGVHERRLREIGARMQSGVDLDTILQTAIEDVASALGVPAGFVQLYEGLATGGPPAE